jgi:hypothetical protein
MKYAVFKAALRYLAESGEGEKTCPKDTTPKDQAQKKEC